MSKYMKINLLAIVGPTASGKTALSIAIAKKYNGEIIAADSRTVYKFMDIGTAKPSMIERSNVPHWGFDLVAPDQNMTVADYKAYADNKIKEIYKRKHLPILVGGSGLYVDAVMYDFNFAPANERLRQELEGLNITELQQKIISKGLKMPENHQNKRYLIRVLERGNVPLTRKKLQPGAVIIGINPSKEILKTGIKKRVLRMIKDGVIEEVKLVSDKYGWQNEAMSGGAYRVLKPLIEGQIDKNEAIDRLVASDMKLAKKQMTWFKRNPDIHWSQSVKSASSWLDKQISGKLESCN
jgi:tRNA dimethylallyltransferase